MDEDTQKRILQLEKERDEYRMQAEEWGFALKEARERLEAIEPVYRKLYRNPFYWLWRPIDDRIEGRILMRCAGPQGQGGCGKLFIVKDMAEPGPHLKHIWHRETDTTWWEYIKIRYLRSI